MRKGHFFETLVKLIQESFRDKKETQILQRHKLLNTAGRKREFDVVIKTSSNNYPILIVIECKDSAKSIPVEKMEAFITKCNRIPSINKRIFVSRCGYHADAVNAAKEADVILYEFKDIDSSAIQSWVDDLNFTRISTFPSISRCFLIIKNLNGAIIEDSTLYSDAFPEPIIPSNLMKDLFEFNRQKLNELAMEIHNDPKNNVPPGASIDLDCGQDLEGLNWYVKKGEQKFFVESINAVISYKIEIEKLQADVSKAYINNSNGEKPLEMASFASVLPNSRFTVIKDPKKENFIQVMVTNNDGGPINFMPALSVSEGLKVTIGNEAENKN